VDGSPETVRALRRAGEEVGRMLGGWIKYLARCDFKDRGRHGLNANAVTIFAFRERPLRRGLE
jgi:hypothetical protein